MGDAAFNTDALHSLLAALEELKCCFTEDCAGVLIPLVQRCLGECPDARWLLEVVQYFGWHGTGFSRPVDARALSCRLRTFLFDGLQRKGRGAFAVVYKARDRLTGETVTLKKLRLDDHGGHAGEEGVSGGIIREVSLLKELDHPHIVRLKDVIWDSSRLFLVMEYMDVNFAEFMASQNNSLSVDKIRVYMHQLLTGLHFCHMHRILHRDLKPHNILVDLANDRLKIADFGLARSYTPPLRAYTHEVVTLLYRPPEILLGQAVYSTAVDLWSVGCIFAEMALGCPLFQGDSEIGQLYQIFKVLGTPDNTSWPGVSRLPDWQACFPAWAPTDLSQIVGRLGPEGLDLLRGLLQLDPARRCSARTALAHPFFAPLSRDMPSGPPAPAERTPSFRHRPAPVEPVQPPSPLTLRSGRRIERSESKSDSHEADHAANLHAHTHDSHPQPRAPQQRREAAGPVPPRFGPPAAQQHPAPMLQAVHTAGPVTRAAAAAAAAAAAQQHGPPNPSGILPQRLLATTQLHVQPDSTVRVITRPTLESHRIEATPEATLPSAMAIDERPAVLDDVCMLYSQSPGIDTHAFGSPYNDTPQVLAPSPAPQPHRDSLLDHDLGVQTRNAAARRQAQEMLAAQGLDKGARDESLAPSDASEQMHVELIEGGPILSMRITRSQGVQR